MQPRAGVMRLRAWRTEDDRGDNTAAGPGNYLPVLSGREADGEQEKPPVPAG